MTLFSLLAVGYTPCKATEREGHINGPHFNVFTLPAKFLQVASELGYRIMGDQISLQLVLYIVNEMDHTQFYPTCFSRGKPKM